MDGDSPVSLKKQKELFVTGHDGTTPWELLLVCSAAPIGIWLFQSLRALEAFLETKKSTTKIRTSSSSLSSSLVPSSILAEAIVLWLPFLICQTNLLYPWGVILLVAELQVSVFIFLYFWTTKRWMRIKGMKNPDEKKPSLDTVNAEEEKEDNVDQLKNHSLMRDCMTVYRSSMLYLTFVAILAVDFHVFPRRFAKTEVAGYGLMDLGAGSFVVAAGLVSPRARHCRTTNRISFGKKDVIRIAPLLLIGFIRLATNKGLEYQEHVSEYGVHWNFFFTLAIVTPLGSMLPGSPTWIIPTAMLVAYQAVLSVYAGQDYIENAPRTHCNPQLLSDMLGNNPMLQQICALFAANREGVLGCIGYLFLYLMSEYIAYGYLWTARTTNSTMWKIASVLWLILHITTILLDIKTSRRSTNASFCIWTLAHIMTLMAAMYSALSLYNDTNNNNSSACRRSRVPVVIQAVNKHGLLAFLIANLLTGLTNISINTLAVSDHVALLILFVYLCAVGGAALVLHLVLKTASGKAGSTSQRSSGKEKKTKEE